MGWLDSLEYDYWYVCPEGHETVYRAASDHDRTQLAECSTCQKAASFVRFKGVSAPPIGKVAYDKNGRKAYCINSGNGKPTYISQSKYHYMETGEIKNHYTPEYHRHLLKDPEKNATLLGTDDNRRMAHVKKAIDSFKPAKGAAV